MKRALPMLALVLVVVGVIVFSLRRTGGLGAKFPASRAAELAPAETLGFLCVPDLERTLTRWEAAAQPAQSGMTEAQQEEWHNFVADWKREAEEDPSLRPFFDALPALWRAAPGGLFLASTNFGGATLPQFVGGVSFRGKKTDVESLVRVLKDQLLARWPEAKSELSSHRGIEIETIQSSVLTRPGLSIWLPGTRQGLRYYFGTWPFPEPRRAGQRVSADYPKLHLAYRDDWLFFASDLPLLTAALDRCLRRPDAAPSLAQNPDFAACRKQELPEADLLAWQLWDPEATAIAGDASKSLAVLWGHDPKAIQAMHYTWRLDGPLRDRLYFHASPPEPGAGPRRLPRKIAPSGLSVTDFATARAKGEFVSDQLFLSAQWKTLGFLFAAQTLGRDDLSGAFEPEVTFVFLETEENGRSNFGVALKVRDLPKARQFAEAIAAAEPNAKMRADGAATRWDWPAPNHQDVPPPIVLTKTHLLIGATRGREVDGDTHGREGGEVLKIIPADAAPVQSVAAPNEALFCQDTEALFHECALPLPCFAIRYAPLAAPTFEKTSFAKQHRPGTLRLRRQDSGGWLVESDLSIDGARLFNQWLGHEQ